MKLAISSPKYLGDILTKEELKRFRDLILEHARTELKLRSPRDAALKACAWYLIAFKAKGIEDAGKLPPDKRETRRQEIRQAAFQFLDTFNLKDSLSYRERSFLFDIKPQIEEERDNATFDWRYERVWAMLWALGHLSALNTPESKCQPEHIEKVFETIDVKTFIDKANLRPTSKVLDKYDLVHRYRAAIHEAKEKGQDLKGKADEDVAREWYIALNWLTGDQDPEDYVTESHTPRFRQGQSEGILKKLDIPVNPGLPFFDVGKFKLTEESLSSLRARRCRKLC